MLADALSYGRIPQAFDVLNGNGLSLAQFVTIGAYQHLLSYNEYLLVPWPKAILRILLKEVPLF